MKKEKKLLLITQGFPYGESEQSFLSTEFLTLNESFQITVLAMDSREEMIHPVPTGVKAERYEIPKLKNAKNIPLLFGLLNKTVIWELFSAMSVGAIGIRCKRARDILGFYLSAKIAEKKLSEIIARDSIDVVYTFWCTPMTLAALFLKKRYPKLKVITRFHGVDLYLERSPLQWQPYRFFIAEKSDRLVFACEAGREYFLQHWGKKYAWKSVLSYLGCKAMERFPFQGGDVLRLVSCSNAIPLKRIHLIIDALALLPENVRVHWEHIGDGVERKKLEKMAEERLENKMNITWNFRGFVPNDRLAYVYREVRPHLFITTTSTEGGAPVSIQEIFSCGIPAIGPDVGGVSELILQNKTGFLLSPDPDVLEVARAISEFYALDLEQRRKMGDEAYHLWQKNFDANNNARHFLEILKGI